VQLPFQPHPTWPPTLLGQWERIDHDAVKHASLTARRVAPGLSPRFIEQVCLPLSGWIAAKAREGRRLIAFGGPPGSGKSTLVRTLELLLAELHGMRAASFSLDDVYHTKARREELSRDVHPLLATRGVPGTHDLDLAHSLLDELAVAGPKHVVWLPRFDKLADDRVARDAWQPITFPPSVVVVDGWCWGAEPSSDTSLQSPVNAREAQHDADGTWRRHVRDQLAGPYARLFARADYFVRLDSPNWAMTLEWRVQQQLELRGIPGPASTEDRLRLTHFLELFERVARSPSSISPDFVLSLGADHELERLVVKKER
jgi:D-glycerate 3-kinase